MTNYRVCRFFGGPYDGNVMRLDESIIRCVRVPGAIGPGSVITPTGIEPDDRYATHRVHTYSWDGTTNRAGEHRMRWSPPKL